MMRDPEQVVQASIADPALAQPQRSTAHLSKEQQVLQRLERVRHRKARLREERITMAHGAGGKATMTLIEALFLEAFRNPLLEPLEDQAVFSVDGVRLAFTTDSFVGVAAVFPRWQHRRPGSQRNRERPGRLRRPAALSLGGIYS